MFGQNNYKAITLVVLRRATASDDDGLYTDIEGGGTNIILTTTTKIERQAEATTGEEAKELRN